MKWKFACVTAVLVSLAAGMPTAGAAGAKAYPLKTCVVSGEKLGGDMGDPYVFTHRGREIKLCCKSCLKDFNKEPAKFIRKLEEAEKGKADNRSHGQHQHKH